jgi:uncharacterized protein YuzE
MKIKHFQETDTLHIEFRPGQVLETRDLDENTLLDLDAAGNIVAMTIEHARDRAMPHTAQDLATLAAQLPPSGRLQLAETLLANLDMADPQLSAAWAEEAEVRLAAYRRGELGAFSEANVFGELEPGKGCDEDA